MVRFACFIKWFGLVSTFPKRFEFKWLRVHITVWFAFGFYINGSVRFGSVSRQRNRTKPKPNQAHC